MFVEINGNQYNTLNFTAYRYLANRDHPIGLEIHYAGGTKLIKDFESESERSEFTENLGDTYIVLNDIAYNALYFTAYYTEDVMLPTPSYNVVIHYAGATKLIKKSSTEAERDEFVKLLEEMSIGGKYDDTELRQKIADLKEEVDGVVAASDVKDIVGTYSALEEYDTSKLGDNDILKVLQDETREYAQTYYRWHKSEGTYSYIGKEGPYYTKEQVDEKIAEIDQPIDNKTITKNTAEELQAVGVAESNKGTATKTWVGTQEEYDALESIDNDTLYYITDGVPEFGDGTTIAPNMEGLLQALGMIESNKGKVSRLWIGTKAEYDELETKDEGTIYYLTDEEELYATKDYVDEKIAEVEMFKFPNTTIVGTPTITHGQVSDFTMEDYLEFPFLVDFRGRAFEINFAFTTGLNIDTQQNILDSDFGLAFAIRNKHLVLALSVDGSSWLTEQTGSLTLEPQTTYRVKITWNGLLYKVSYSIDGGKNYVDDITFGQSLSPYPKQMYIGVGKLADNYFEGIINLNYANVYISGELIWQGMDDVGLATRIATDMSNIDQAGIDYINGLIDAKGGKLDFSTALVFENTSQVSNSKELLSKYFTDCILNNKSFPVIILNNTDIRHQGIYYLYSKSNSRFEYRTVPQIRERVYDGNDWYSGYRLIISYNTNDDGLITITDFSFEYSPSEQGRFLTTSNTYSYTPTKNYHPATKKYVDDQVGNIDTLLQALDNGGGVE